MVLAKKKKKNTNIPLESAVCSPAEDVSWGGRCTYTKEKKKKNETKKSRRCEQVASVGVGTREAEWRHIGAGEIRQQSFPRAPGAVAGAVLSHPA